MTPISYNVLLKFVSNLIIEYNPRAKICKKQEVQILLERNKKSIKYTCTHTCTYTHIHMHTLEHYVYTYTYICLSICIYLYIHTHTMQLA